MNITALGPTQPHTFKVTAITLTQWLSIHVRSEQQQLNLMAELFIALFSMSVNIK
jgi:hypothetical protein